MEYTSGNFLCETIVPSGELIVSRTDLKGIITYANDTFAEISGVFKNDVLVEYKSIRTPISFQDKVKHQLLYDKIKKDSNEPTRKVTYN